MRLAKVVVSTMKNTDFNSQTRGLIWVYHRKVGFNIIHVLNFIKPCFKYEKQGVDQKQDLREDTIYVYSQQ